MSFLASSISHRPTGDKRGKFNAALKSKQGLPACRAPQTPRDSGVVVFDDRTQNLHPFQDREQDFQTMNISLASPVPAERVSRTLPPRRQLLFGDLIPLSLFAVRTSPYFFVGGISSPHARSRSSLPSLSASTDVPVIFLG